MAVLVEHYRWIMVANTCQAYSGNLRSLCDQLWAQGIAKTRCFSLSNLVAIKTSQYWQGEKPHDKYQFPTQTDVPRHRHLSSTAQYGTTPWNYCNYHLRNETKNLHVSEYSNMEGPWDRNLAGRWHYGKCHVPSKTASCEAVAQLSAAHLSLQPHPLKPLQLIKWTN